MGNKVPHTHHLLPTTYGYAVGGEREAANYRAHGKGPILNCKWTVTRLLTSGHRRLPTAYCLLPSADCARLVPGMKGAGTDRGVTADITARPGGRSQNGLLRVLRPFKA